IMNQNVQGGDRIVRPGECTRAELGTFVGTGAEGGQVALAGREGRIVAASWLGFHYVGDEFVGVAALKRPTPSRVRRVYGGTEASEPTLQPLVELGWVHTKERFRGRGIARRLCEQLLEKASAGQVFATVRQDNDPMRHVLAALGLPQVGKPFICSESAM